MLMRKRAETMFREKNIKPTSIRLDVLQILLGSKTHPSADHIYVALKDRVPTLSKTSVYNTLHLLVSEGLVQKLLIEEDTARYDAQIKQHTHFLCRTCRAVYDLTDDTFKTPRLINGFLVENRQIYYEGLCPSCQNQQA